MPRHPPCALSSLTNFYILHSVAGVGSGCLCSQTVHLSMLLFLLGCLVSIFCVRYLCILLYAIFKVQKFDKVCFRFRWALSTSCFAHGYAPHILRLCHPSGCVEQARRILLYVPDPSCAETLSTGDGGIRTLDPLLARQVLSQLSYIPIDSGSHLLSHAVSSIVPSAV